MIEVIFGQATLPNPSGNIPRRPTSYRFYHGGIWSPPTHSISLTSSTPIGRAGSVNIRSGPVWRATVVVTPDLQIITVGDGDRNVTRETGLPTRIR